MLRSLQRCGIEYLWQGDPAYWSGQAPICFPITGALPGGQAEAYGRHCQMPRHGFARNCEFICTQNQEDSVTFSLRADRQTKLAYPFDFELGIKYTLSADTLYNEYIIINHDAQTMPFFIGGHPAFNCPLIKNETFEDYSILFGTAETAQCLRADIHTGCVSSRERYPVCSAPGKISLDHRLFDSDAMIFDTLRSNTVTLAGPSGHGVTMDFTGFGTLLIWSSANNAPFVALEPWTGMAGISDTAGVFEEKAGVTLLKPGKTAAYTFALTLF